MHGSAFKSEEKRKVTIVSEKRKNHVCDMGHPCIIFEILKNDLF
jgi:hypothetical protein